MILGKLAQNLKRTSSKVKGHLYARDPEDCLIFNYEFTAQVEKHHVIGTVWEVQFADEDFHIDLSQELYKECLERTRVLTNLVRSRWPNIEEIVFVQSLKSRRIFNYHSPQRTH